MDFIYSTDMPTLHFVRSPFNPIIDKGTFTNDSTEITFPVHSLTFSETYQVNASLPEQYKDFYKESVSYSSSKTYTNVDKWYGILGCTYFPMVILDYSSVFKYL